MPTKKEQGKPTKKERAKAKRTQSARSRSTSAAPSEIDTVTSASDAVPGGTSHAPSDGRWQLTKPQAIFMIAIVGAASLFTGLGNAFNTGDDGAQVVNNVPVHSISNIGLFFQGGTFYNGQGLAPLSGSYYRPLMTTVFSLLYTIFGANPVPFHGVQLALCTASAVLLYLVFVRFTFPSPLALVLALIFLVHPIDSQVAFAIPDMQDALFLFFGILALWLLMRSDTVRSMFWVALCLVLALLSKETAIIFVGMALAYLYLWRRSRLAAFIGTTALPLLLWFGLRVNAVGIVGPTGNGPINSVSLSGRLLNAPAIPLQYVIRLLYPWNLASSYYWVHSTFSVEYFVLPLLVDLAVLAAIIATGVAIGRRGSPALHRTFWFFAGWSGLGLLAHIQIIPLDQTANEGWFRVCMPGVLGMIGVAATAFQRSVRLDRRATIALGTAVVVVLGASTALRGNVWGDPAKLAAQDIANSADNYFADETAAYMDLQSGDYQDGLRLALTSVALHPTADNYGTLGQLYVKLRDYPAAKKAYDAGLELGNNYGLYEDLAELTTVFGDPAGSKKFLLDAVGRFPSDAALWLALAYLDYGNGDVPGAKNAISEAYKIAPSASGVDTLYPIIMNGLPLKVRLTP